MPKRWFQFTPQISRAAWRKCLLRVCGCQARSLKVRWSRGVVAEGLQGGLGCRPRPGPAALSPGRSNSARAVASQVEKASPAELVCPVRRPRRERHLLLGGFGNLERVCGPCCSVPALRAVADAWRDCRTASGPRWEPLAVPAAWNAGCWAGETSSPRPRLTARLCSEPVFARLHLLPPGWSS